jgi:O-antigen/teichoic acid export membrane protein
MNPLKKLAGETALYGLSSIIGRAVNFLLTPLYTHLFLTAEFGVMSKLYAYVAFFNIIYTYGMETAYFRFASRGNSEKSYNQAFSLILFTSLIFSGLIWMQSENIATLLGYEGKGYYINWIALTLAIDAIVAIPFARLRLQKKALKFASVRLSNIFLNIGFNVFFLVLCPAMAAGKFGETAASFVSYVYDPEIGVGYVFLSNLLANAAFLLMLAKDLLQVKIEFSWHEVKPMLVYASPLLIMGLAGMVNELLDRLLLEEILPDNFYDNLSPRQALGVYGACYKLSMFISLAVQAFKFAAEPFFFTNAADKNSPMLFAKVMNWFIVFCIFTFVFISINIDLIGPILVRNPAYHQGFVVVPVLLLANVFLGIYYNLTVWFKLTDKTSYGTYIGIIGAAITLGLNILLIPVLGYMGSAIATLVCYSTMAAICYFLGEKHYPIRYNVKAALTYIITGSILVWLGLMFNPENLLLKYTFRLALLAAFVVTVLSVERINPKAIRRLFAKAPLK